VAKRPIPLDPHGRSTLRNVLAPPEGFQLQHALGTAYSLDAETLVTIPLFAAGMGAADIDKSVGVARIYELGTRLTLLVQGDRISISKQWANSRPLLRLVGDAVVPCSIKDGSFHPKLLVLKFASVDKPQERYFRVVISTRNLTADNSWDSLVVLDQERTGVSVNGLAETVGGLAQFVNDQAHPAVEQCRRIAEALKDVRFQPLHGVADLEVRLFHPGCQNAEEIHRKIKGDDLLVISPFVRQGFLDGLAAQAGASKEHRWLVTRPVDVPTSAFTKYQVFKISDAAVPAHESSNAERAQGRLVGLHAKIYLASSKKGGTRLVVTSANATPSGWTHNVEVAVTGVIKAAAMQVQTLLADDSSSEERSFRSVLERITPSAVEREEPEPRWVKRVRRILAGAAAVGRVRKGPPQVIGVTLNFIADRGDWPDGVVVKMHFVGYQERCTPLTRDKNGMSGSLEIDPSIELTPFVALTLSYADDAPLEVVLAMSLEGDIDWGREAARKVLAHAARPALYQELLWYFGVKGSSSGSSESHDGKKPSKARKAGPQLPILERVLQRVHGPNAKGEIATIDSLLAGLTDAAEDEQLATMWHLVKESLK
jgi:hypothetical protein